MLKPNLSRTIKKNATVRISDGEVPIGWYDKITGLIYPDVLITNFTEVIQWQQ